MEPDIVQLHQNGGALHDLGQHCSHKQNYSTLDFEFQYDRHVAYGISSLINQDPLVCVSPHHVSGANPGRRSGNNKTKGILKCNLAKDQGKWPIAI